MNVVNSMRMRNVKNKDEILNNSEYFIGDPFQYMGSWNKVFKNNNPIYLEIGMGKGKFIRENAKVNPNINYIGLERYDSIIAKCLPKIEQNTKNLVIVRANAIEIDKIFNHEIDCLFLNFSDPWPKVRHHSRRLSSEVFLKKYDQIFKKEINIHMRTDNTDLFAYSLESFSNHGLYLHDVSLNYHLTCKDELITTEYEDKFSSNDIPICHVIADKTKCLNK